MANKQYEMLFTLGAQLNSKFQGSFESAQKILSATQKEIEALNKSQSNISAYQKQQKSLEQSQAKLQMYRDQLAVTRQSLETLRNTENASAVDIATLSKQEIELKNRINSTETAIHDKTERLKQMQSALEKSGIDANNLSGESARLSNALAELSENEERAAEEASKLGSSGAEAFDAVGSALVASGIAAGLHELAEAYKDCVELSAEFGSTMSTVEALSGATAQEMNALSQQAKDLGATTAFTANQSAEAMTYMGMAGWNAQEMMSGMGGVISLAAASGEDLAMVSDIVTDNLTAFGLKASDTAHFADVLAQTASKSNTSVSIMGETFKSSASIAGALGYSVEDVAAAVGLMANSGVKGSIAGTALKNTFNGLLEGATLTSKAFGEYEFSAVNADGTMKGFAETIEELRVRFDQMTESERVSNAMAIAGQRGYNGLLAILNSTNEDYQSLTNSINNCAGAAQRMAEIKLDNLKGDITLLQSATDGLKASVGGLFEDELRSGTQIVTNIVSKINEFVEQNPAVVKALMAVTAEVGLIVGAYTAYTAIKKAAMALDAAGIGIKASENGLLMLLNVQLGANARAQTAAALAQMKLNAAMLANPAVIVTASVVALTAAITLLKEAFKQTALEEETLTTATITQQQEVESLSAEYEKACEAFGEADTRTKALKYDLDEATAAVESQSFSVSELYSRIDSLHNSTETLISNYTEATTKIDTERESAQILVAKLREIGSSSDTAAKKQALMAPIVEHLNELYPSLGLNVDNVTTKLDSLSGAIDRVAFAEGLQAKYNSAHENYAGLLDQQAQFQSALEEAETTTQRARQKYLIATDEYKTAIATGAAVGLVGFVTAGLAGKDAVDAADETLTNAQEKESTARADLKAIEEQIAECEAVFEKYGETVNGTSEEMASSQFAVSYAIEDTKKKTESLLQAYNDAYQAAYDSVTGQYNLWTEAEQSIPTSIDKINSSLSSQQSYWDSYNTNLEKLLGKTKDVDGLRDVLASFADGSTESVNAIAGMANASDDQLKKMVENYQKAQEEEQKVAETLAEVKVDFEDELDEITNAMTDAVGKMNMDDEARSAAQNTINAYVNALSAGAGSAYAAADIVANATAAALAGLPMQSAPAYSGSSTVGPRIMQSTPTYSGSTVGPRMPSLNAPFNAYASGTESAEAGWAIVGENGPEAVFMRGGETVYNSSETREMLGGTQITIAPTITLNGGGTEEQLQGVSERLIDMIKDALEEAGIDKRRSVYA